MKKFSDANGIIVCKPDKGRGVVILDKLTYVNHVENLVSDRSKFEIVSESMEKLTLKVEDKINNFFAKK